MDALLLCLIFTLQTFLAHIILVIAMNFIGWLRGTVDASTHVIASNPGSILLRSLSASTIMAIRDNTALTAGFVLGLAIITAINYIRSPWRKLPPGPRRFPIFGNSLQLSDKSWLLSKNCKERFVKNPHFLKSVHRH